MASFFHYGPSFLCLANENPSPQEYFKPPKECLFSSLYQMCYQHSFNYISWGHHLSNVSNHSLQWLMTEDWKPGKGYFLLRIATVDPNSGQRHLHQRTALKSRPSGCTVFLWTVESLFGYHVSVLWALESLRNSDYKTVSQSDMQSLPMVDE